MNPKHEDRLKNFLKYFFLLFKQSWYKINKTEYVKNQKTKYVIQKSEHIFKTCIDCIVHNDIFLKVIFSLWSNMFCEMFYLLCCFTLAELKCFYLSPTLMNYLQMDNWAHLLKHWHNINSSYKVGHMRWYHA